MGNVDATSAMVTARQRRKRKKLSPSQKYEIYGLWLTSSVTQRELAEQYAVDRSTIRSICATAEQGALGALAAAVPGRRDMSGEEVELRDARAEIERLNAMNERFKATICEQALLLHTHEERGMRG